MESAGSEFWNNAVNPGGQLTLECLSEAIEAIKNDHSIDPCKLGQHLVSPTGYASLKDGGTARCAHCAQIVGPF